MQFLSEQEQFERELKVNFLSSAISGPSLHRRNIQNIGEISEPQNLKTRKTRKRDEIAERLRKLKSVEKNLKDIQQKVELELNGKGDGSTVENIITLMKDKGLNLTERIKRKKDGKKSKENETGYFEIRSSRQLYY